MKVNFYDSYQAHKSYSTPELKDKHIRQFDRDFWRLTTCDTYNSVLEIGCGTGHFLGYLKHKKVTHFLGIDQDPALADFIPTAVKDHFKVQTVEQLLGEDKRRSFDRIVLLDVLEHFSPDDGVALLRSLSEILSPGGSILVRIPNIESPWGAKYQFGDLTHRAAYTPTSLRQLATAAGFSEVQCHVELTGSPIRRMLDRGLHNILSKILMTPPEIWSANFLAVLKPGDD